MRMISRFFSIFKSIRTSNISEKHPETFRVVDVRDHINQQPQEIIDPNLFLRPECQCVFGSSCSGCQCLTPLSNNSKNSNNS